jgi:hypothetical protein
MSMLNCVPRCCSSLLVLGLFVSPLPAQDQKISFNRDVRPILSDACFHCHGPDDQQRQAGLRFDQRDSAVSKSESGSTPIVPGNLDASELVRRVTSKDESVVMPPPDSGKSISPEQIEMLTRWIAQGAEYEGHWAFQTVIRPTVPEVSGDSSTTGFAKSKNPIDRFIESRLMTAGLQPSPPASRETLIRRVSLDLTGLPPTPAEVDAFLADTSPDAYGKVVDRLLTSPHYGERMALTWLDYARYADSNGYQVDASREIWAWRDWTINAYNRNLPFDQFTVEQIAGDLLPDATRNQIIATGFNRNHRLNGEGGRIVEEWFVETVIDRVETTGLTWLGLTFNCCRCHDHKYDPISQREFYQMFAFFNSNDESGVLAPNGNAGNNTEPTISVSTPEQDAELARLDDQVRDTDDRVKALTDRLPELLAAWEPEFRKQLESKAEPWTSLKPEEITSSGGAKFQRQDDGSWLASGPNAANDVYSVNATVAEGSLGGLLLECFPDKQLPVQSLGRYPNGNFVLTKLEAQLTAPSLKKPQSIKLRQPVADYSQKGWTIAMVNDGNKSNGWAVDGPTKKEPRKALFAFDVPIDVPADATITITLHHEALSQHNIGRFRISVSPMAPETLGLDGSTTPQEILDALAVAADQRKPKQQQTLHKYFRANVPNELREADTALAAARKRAADFRMKLPGTMIMREVAPRDAFILKRGEYDKPGDKVVRGIPAVLPAMPDGAPMNRLGLARSIVSRENPLTARVWVNREWERFFGIGLVKTSENFGSQSEYPSHPRLLDWLAAEFMEPSISPAVAGVAARAWDMKAFQKLIVTSATYRQASGNVVGDASRTLNAGTKVDSTNRLLWRGPRFRLPGEIIRDQALAVSGLLTRKIGGPSVRPYMPMGVWDETSKYGNLRNYKHDTGEGLYRRTMYTIWKRTAAPPSMLLFDAPNREICTVKRSRTNTPLQALSLLNEVTFVEAARHLAERILTEGGVTSQERLEFGFGLVTARKPSKDELRILDEGLNADLARFNAKKSAAESLLAFGDTKSSTVINQAELAAWTLTANVLLNLDEVVTRE